MPDGIIPLSYGTDQSANFPQSCDGISIQRGPQCRTTKAFQEACRPLGLAEQETSADVECTRRSLSEVARQVEAAGARDGPPLDRSAAALSSVEHEIQDGLRRRRSLEVRTSVGVSSRLARQPGPPGGSRQASAPQHVPMSRAELLCRERQQPWLGLGMPSASGYVREATSTSNIGSGMGQWIEATSSSTNEGGDWAGRGAGAAAPVRAFSPWRSSTVAAIKAREQRLSGEMSPSQVLSSGGTSARAGRNDSSFHPETRFAAAQLFPGTSMPGSQSATPSGIQSRCNGAALQPTTSSSALTAGLGRSSTDGSTGQGSPWLYPPPHAAGLGRSSTDGSTGQGSPWLSPPPHAATSGARVSPAGPKDSIAGNSLAQGPGHLLSLSMPGRDFRGASQNPPSPRSMARTAAVARERSAWRHPRLSEA